MKYIIKSSHIILGVFLFSLISFAQDSTSVGEKSEKRMVETGKKENMLFGGKIKSDIFIDKDGDGICDFRAKGMSFEKFKNRTRQGAGSGNGKGKGNR